MEQKMLWSLMEKEVEYGSPRKQETIYGDYMGTEREGLSTSLSPSGFCTREALG